MDDQAEGGTALGHRLRAAAVPALAGALAVVLALTLGSTSQRADGRPGSTAGASARATPLPSLTDQQARSDALRLSLAEPSPVWQQGEYEPDLDAVRDLLDRRSRAAVAGDVSAFIDTGLVDATARPQAEAIAALPVSEWSYTLGGVRTDGIRQDAETAIARETYGEDAYVIRATLRYRLDGYDRSTVTSEHLVTVAFQSGTWKVIDDLPADGSKELWDFGGLSVVRGAASMVVGLGPNAPSSATLESYAAMADRGVRDVTHVWGREWQRQVLVVAAPTTAVMAKALGRRAADYKQIAAVTTADHGETTRISRGDRVFVNPTTFAKLGSRGRTIVLRHEITHVATLAAADDDMPTWMEEGFADYVGYRGSGVSTTAIVRELSAWVASGAHPRTLPSDEDYDGDNGRLVESYEQSWLAAHLIADDYGKTALVELYRAMQANTKADPSQGTETAFELVLGISYADFVKEWRAEVKALG